MNQRKTIAAAFAAFILMPLILSTGLQFFQAYLKGRVAHRFEEESLVSISVPLKNVQWVEEEKEVRIDGKMFDIKQWTSENGNFVATGVWDEKETMVMEWLQHFNEKEQNRMIIQLLVLAQCIFLIHFFIFNPVSQFLVRKYRNYIFSLTQPVSLPRVQPPRKLF